MTPENEPIQHENPNPYDLAGDSLIGSSVSTSKIEALSSDNLIELSERVIGLASEDSLLELHWNELKIPIEARDTLDSIRAKVVAACDTCQDPGSNDTALLRRVMVPIDNDLSLAINLGMPLVTRDGHRFVPEGSDQIHEVAARYEALLGQHREIRRTLRPPSETHPDSDRAF